jgi:hypothetical protein
VATQADVGRPPGDFAETFAAITGNVSKVVQGKTEVVELVMLCLVARATC